MAYDANAHLFRAKIFQALGPLITIEAIQWNASLVGVNAAVTSSFELGVISSLLLENITSHRQIGLV